MAIAKLFQGLLSDAAIKSADAPMPTAAIREDRLFKAPVSYGAKGTEREMLGLDSEEALQAYQDSMPFKKPKVDIPEEIQQKAQALSNDIPTDKAERDAYFNAREEYRKLVDETAPYSFHEEAPPVYTVKDLATSLDKDKVKKGIVGLTTDIPENEQVSLRFDIPAYKYHGVYSVTVHEAGGKNVLGYAPTALLTNVEMPATPVKSKKIAETGKKTPVITMNGTWVNHDPKELRNLADELIKANKNKPLEEQEWVQVSVNPGKSGSFVTVSKNSEGKIESFPINEAEAVIQIGKMILAKPYKPGKQMDWQDYYSKNFFSAGGLGLGAGGLSQAENLFYNDPMGDTTKEEV